MSTASFIASQRTDHAIPCALACRALGVPPSTFYAQLNHTPSPYAAAAGPRSTPRSPRASEPRAGPTGPPRVLADLRAEGWRVSKKTVEASMARQGLQGRRPRRRRGLTRPDQSARPAPDLPGRDFSADGVDRKWVGDFKQIHTGEGPVFLATVEDLFSRRLLGFALSDCHPTAELAQAAINMAVAARGGDVAGVIFHTDKGAQYTSGAFVSACARARDPPVHGPGRLRPGQRRGRVVLLNPATRTALKAPLPHPPRGPPRRRRLDRPVVQPAPPPLQRRHARADRVRTRQRGINQPSKKRGEAHIVPFGAPNPDGGYDDYLALGVRVKGTDGWWHGDRGIPKEGVEIYWIGQSREYCTLPGPRLLPRPGPLPLATHSGRLPILGGRPGPRDGDRRRRMVFPTGRLHRVGYSPLRRRLLR